MGEERFGWDPDEGIYFDRSRPVWVGDRPRGFVQQYEEAHMSEVVEAHAELEAEVERLRAALQSLCDAETIGDLWTQLARLRNGGDDGV